MLTPNNINAQIATAQIDRLTLVAPTLVGNQGAALQRIKVSGQVNMTEDRLFAENAVLETDVGALGVAASIPTQMAIPTATQPWIPDAQWNVKGTVDLAKLLHVAPG